MDDHKEGMNTNRLTIAFVSPGPFSVPPVVGTSVEHDIEMVAQALQKNHRVIIFTRKCPEYPLSTRKGNMEIERLDYRSGRQYIREVTERLTALQPDIIQVENRPKYVSTIKKKLPHIPLILNMHSMTFASSRSISPPKLQKSMRSIDALITNSHYLRQEYEQQFPILKGKAFGVHLGIDPFSYMQAGENRKRISRLKRKFGIKPEHQVLLFVGRLLPEKGVHHLIDALPQVIKKHPHAKLLIAGSPKYGKHTPTRYLQMIEQKAASLREHVTFTKFIRPKEMPSMYQLADIVVTPSVWKEPFCRVNLEAMSAGKPIVTTKRGGIPEVVTHQKHGYVLSLKGLSRTLPLRLNQLLASPKKRNQFGKAGFKQAKALSWQRTADQYMSIYNTFKTVK